jgi:DNA processing protein
MSPGVASGAEELARDSGMSLSKVRAVLPVLELAGFVTRQEGGWVRL